MVMVIDVDYIIMCKDSFKFKLLPHKPIGQILQIPDCTSKFARELQAFDKY